MREHMGLYRGKRKDNGEWVEGSLLVFPHSGRTMIFDRYDLTFYRVDPDTVGECTGLPDKNGKLIFEGDLLKGDWGKVYKVFYKKKSCSFMAKLEQTPNEYEKGNYRMGEAWSNTIKIIGNVVDNPELLQQEE